MFSFLLVYIIVFNRNTPSIIKYIGTIKQGLSLIVVDDALVQSKQVLGNWYEEQVSILIVLDDALVLVEVYQPRGNE